MDWQPIETMPYETTVQIGAKGWTSLATRKKCSGEDYIRADFDIPMDEVTATHWRDYDAPPTHEDTP